MSKFQEIQCTYIYLNKHSVKQEIQNNTKPRGWKKELVLHGEEKLLKKAKEPEC